MTDSNVRLWRGRRCSRVALLALRGKIRDFYTGAPAYNLRAMPGGQHNVVAGAAFVIRWDY